LALDTAVGQKKPFLYALPTRDLAPVCLSQIPVWMSCSIAHPSSGVMHFIRVSLAFHQKSSSFTRAYCPPRRCNRSRSALSSGKPPILKYILNGVRQFEWISMTLGDSVMLPFRGGVSWDGSAALVAFAKAFERPLWEPWPDWNRAWLTYPRSHFFHGRYVNTRDRRNCFLTCGAPGNTSAFCHPDMSTLCWPD
jgi:hypothetical protein